MTKYISQEEAVRQILEWSDVVMKGKKLPVGTVRSWHGNQYKKVAEGDWRPVSGGKKGGEKKDGDSLKDGTPDKAKDSNIKRQAGRLQDGTMNETLG